MNLIEAIKSGKPWTYPGGGGTWWKLDQRVTLIPHPEVDQIHTGPQYRNIVDLLECEGFEIKEPTVTITRKQLEAALTDYVLEYGSDKFVKGLCPPLLDFIARKLGLKDE